MCRRFKSAPGHHFFQKSTMSFSPLDPQATARQMTADFRGILAIDESTGTCQKRFSALGIDCTPETRRAYRGMLVSAPVGEWVAGMILFDETLRQTSEDGRSFPTVLADGGMLAGIKVDTGAKELALHAGEKVTEGLDGLRERLAEYAALGARFTKWRAVIRIDAKGQLPSAACIHANAHALARYAALAVEAGLCPMVEPEILMDGPHSIAQCEEVSTRVLAELFAQLKQMGVPPEATVLKTSMVLAGSDAPEASSAGQIAEATLRTLRAAVPPNCAGVVFLSGGQGDTQATENLNAIAKLAAQQGGAPWPISFSFGRSIQRPALNTWAGDNANLPQAAQKLCHRAQMNGLATRGQWTGEG